MAVIPLVPQTALAPPVEKREKGEPLKKQGTEPLALGKRRPVPAGSSPNREAGW
jgi:hypothetical protein